MFYVAFLWAFSDCLVSPRTIMARMGLEKVITKFWFMSLAVDPILKANNECIKWRRHKHVCVILFSQYKGLFSQDSQVDHILDCCAGC